MPSQMLIASTVTAVIAVDCSDHGTVCPSYVYHVVLAGARFRS